MTTSNAQCSGVHSLTVDDDNDGDGGCGVDHQDNSMA